MIVTNTNRTRVINFLVLRTIKCQVVIFTSRFNSEEKGLSTEELLTCKNSNIFIFKLCYLYIVKTHCKYPQVKLNYKYCQCVLHVLSDEISTISCFRRRYFFSTKFL